MRHTILTLTLLFTIVISSRAQTLQHHKITVGNFTEINVKHSINVDYRSNPDSAGVAVFDASPSMTNVVMFKNNGRGKLTIELQLDSAQTGSLPTIHVYSRYLTKIENSGDSTVRVFNPNVGPKFSATCYGNGRLSIRDISTDEVSAKQLAGNGQLAVSGECQKATLNCAGSGAIQADNLRANEVTAKVFGPVTLGCFARETLVVIGTGPSKIYYGGNPQHLRNRSLGPSLINIGD